MEKIPYVKIEIEDSYLVWFQNSNQYFQLAEPAWFVFERLADLQDVESIANQLSDCYGFDLSESLRFTEEMHERVNEMNKPVEQTQVLKKDEGDILDVEITPYSVYKYQLGSEYIRFSYGEEWLENYIHPLINHLEASADSKGKAHFELYYYNNRVIFRLNNEIKGSWGNDESEYVKGKIFLELINVLHGKTDDDWLMTVHASAITNGKKTILFSAAPGSGKTTMAALLQAQGYHLISDDFVPFDINSPNAYPFPIAMSVKEGAMELLVSLYPELKSKPLNYISPEKSVRYLPIENKLMGKIHPSHDIIFVKYDKTVDFKMKKLKPIQGFPLLLEQIWVPPKPEKVELLFERISQFSFYELVYSNNEKAVNAIKKLFDDE